MRLALKVLWIAAFFESTTCAYRILGVFPFPGSSHWIMFKSLMKALAQKGHQVDVISAFPLKPPIGNYTDITIRKNDYFERYPATIELMTDLSELEIMIMSARHLGYDLCELMKEQPLRDLIDKTPKGTYDVVITEVFCANCYLAFGNHFDAPLVAMVSSVMLPWGNDGIANPDNPSYIPNYALPFTDRMTFWERMLNTIYTFSSKIYFHLYSVDQDSLLKEVFGPDIPSLRELEREIDLYLVNSHFSLNVIRPTVPGFLEVGGLHIHESAEELSPELKKWLDESIHGVVYFSLGSIVRMETFTPEIMADLYAVFAKLSPMRVLWKSDRSLLPDGIPDNVLIMTWIPQFAVLSHENVKVFISHGGLMSLQEAVYAGVPLVGIPFFADQALNIKGCVIRKTAVEIDKRQLNGRTLSAALRTVLEDPSYRENARKISKKFRDRPLSPIDTAIWWVEYVIRHGKGSLRSAAVDLTWWQLALIDVYVFLVSTVGISIYIIYWITRRIFASIRGYSINRIKKVQ